MFTSSLTVYLILIESPRKYKKIQIKFSFPAWCFHVYFHKYMQKSERQPQTISGVVHLKQRLIMSGQYQLVLIKSLKDFIHFYVVHWLMFSNSWFTIWNKYLISLCVKNKLVSSANIIGSNMFEAFFSRSHIKEIGVVLKLSLVEHHNWSSLSLFFLFHWFVEIVSNSRGSIWVIHDFCPLYHIVSTFWEERSGLQCQNPSIGQWIHQVYVGYFQKIHLFDQLIVLQHGQLNDRFGNQIV